MKKFQGRKINKLRKEYDRTRELMFWCYEHPDEKVYDSFTDLYMPKNVCLCQEELRKIRNRVRSIIIKNSRIKFFNLSTSEKIIMMHKLGKEFDIIF